jgi:Immunoglobulin I-set domain/Immunoglobulin domain/PKD domain
MKNSKAGSKPESQSDPWKVARHGVSGNSPKEKIRPGRDGRTGSSPVGAIVRLTSLCLCLFTLHAAATTYYVDINSPNSTPPYTSWGTAATDIQDAIDQTTAGDTVLVTNGVYQTGGHVTYGTAMNRVAISKPIIVSSVNGPAATTIIGSVINSYNTRCAYVTNGAFLVGFTLTGGSLGNGSSIWDFDGAGVFAESGGTISNCVINGSSVFQEGEGGGAYQGVFIKCIFSNNSVPQRDNHTTVGGGACYSTLVNCVLFSNSAGGTGGGAFECNLDNCSVVNNAAAYGGGTSSCTANNCIVYFNSPNDSGSTFSYSCSPGIGGTGNITNDPAFVDLANGDYHLQAGSPCINAGNNAYVTIPFDFDGNPRIVGGTVDIGAYEDQARTIAITSQPANQTNILSQNVTLSVDAISPYPLGYQWFFDSNSIAGGTNSSLVVSNLQLTDTGFYSVAISNSFFSTNSLTALLTVLYPPPAILQPPTNLPVILGSNTMLSLTVTSYLDMTFQWQLNGTNLTDQGEFSGSTTTNLFISGAGIADMGNYDVIVSDSEWSVTSAVATVSILFPTTMTLQPTNKTSIVPNNVSLSAAASGTGPLSFQWFFDGTPLSDGGNISGSASSTLNISGVQLTNAGLYEVLVTNSFSEAASTAMLTVLAPVQIVEQPTNQALLIGDTAVLSVTATGTDPGYQWYFNGELLSDGNGTTGSSTANLTITDVQNDNGGNYQVVISNMLNTVASTIAALTPETSPGPSIRYVNVSNSAPQSPYLTWSTAATNIQDAIDASISGDTIIVTDGVYNVGGETANGTYLTNRVVINKNITVQSVNGPANTIIEGNRLPVQTLEFDYEDEIYTLSSSPDGPGAARCVSITANATLIGFTLTNGATLNQPSYASDGEGGGVWCASTNGDIVSNCVITADNAYYQGGGAFQGTLLNCTVLGNSAVAGGGAANATIIRSLVISNTAPTLQNYSYSGYGGGTFDCTLFSSAVADNYAASYGGGAYGGSVANCTITGNSALDYGGGTASCAATNSIIYYNKIFLNNSSDTNSDGFRLVYCCTTPNAGGANITTPPVLADISHISLNSPCRGAGNPTATYGTDIDGNSWGNPPSIGCSEIPTAGDYGNLAVNISTTFTNWAPGFPLNFQPSISGPVYNTVWNFGDGIAATNQPYISHTWTSAGNYPVSLTAYNDSYPTGVTATLMINVVVPTTYYVNLANPNPVAPYTSWSTAAATIQDAANAAVPGSLVLVTNPTLYVPVPGGDGTYTTNHLAFYDSGGATAPDGNFYRVVITNAITVQTVNGPATTYLWGITSDGRQAGCAFLANGAILSGFTVTNYEKAVSYAQITAPSTNAIITNCVMANYVTVNSGTLENCSLISSSSSANGTLNNCSLIGSGSVNSTLNSCIVSNNSQVLGGVLNNCVIIDNTNLANFEGGGATAEQGYPLVLNNCLISNNVAQASGGSGGGVYNTVQNTPNYYTNCILNNCVLIRNMAKFDGGGAFGAELNNCLIASNSASFGSGVEGGLLVNCTLMGNSNGTAADGTEIFPRGVVLTNCTLMGNGQIGADDCILNQCTISQGLVGAVSSVLNQCTLLQNGLGASASALNNCLLVSNVSSARFGAPNGGGANGCTLTNCILAYNIATNGGGAYKSTLVNCTLIGNSAVTGGGIYDCTADNCILYYNNNGDFFPATTQFPLNYCCASIPATNGIRNIINAPLFVNLATGDYHLQSSSPCINSGNNAYISSATDLDANTRVTGDTVDIGAYEYQTPTSVISYAYLQQYGLPTDGSVDSANLDGTGFTVNQDWIAGLNPTNPASVLAMLTPVTTNTATGVTVTWKSVSGIPYFLQRSTNLASQPSFGTIQSNITGQTNSTSYTDMSATNNVPYFYRVGVVAP